MKIKMDGDRNLSDDLLMLVLMNGGREGGGFHLYPEAKNGDGVFHYLTVPNVSRLTMLRLLPAFMNGTHLKHPKIDYGDFTEMDIEAESAMFIHTDGEIFSGFSSNLRKIRAKIHHQALRVVS